MHLTHKAYKNVQRAPSRKIKISNIRARSATVETTIISICGLVTGAYLKTLFDNTVNTANEVQDLKIRVDLLEQELKLKQSAIPDSDKTRQQSQDIQ